MACSKLEARGHLLHKRGTPPKHISRECIYASSGNKLKFQNWKSNRPALLNKSIYNYDCVLLKQDTGEWIDMIMVAMSRLFSFVSLSNRC